jgi:recombination protein RecT
MKYSKSFQKGYGLWKDEFETMAKKTTLKLLISKYSPLSIEMQKATLTDQSVLKDWEGKSLEYVDNEVVKIDPVANAALKEDERVKDFIKNCKDIKELEKNCKEYCEALPDNHKTKKLYFDKKMDLEL